MNLGLEDKALVVGGASRGLGYAVARELVAEGANVLLVARDLAELDRAADELGEKAYPCVADLSDPADAERVGGVAGAVLGGVDGVLVNAGGPPEGSALELSDEQWLEAFDLLVRGPLALVRGVLPLLEENGGSILFLSSFDSSNVLRPSVTALVDSLARELGPAVRVNDLAPGRCDVDRHAELACIAAFLLSPAASNVSGETIQDDGAPLY